MDNTVIDQFEEPISQNTEDLPPILPVWKFLLLTIISLNLYLIYWFYRIWRHVKAKEGADIKPVWRALFGIFFSFSLLDKISQYARSRNIPSSLNSVVIGILFLVLNMTSRLPDPFWMVSLLSPFLFIQAVQDLNAYSEAEGQQEKQGLTGGEIAIVIVGGLLLGLILIGLFLNE